MSGSWKGAAAAAALVLAGASPAVAAFFAARVVSYVPGAAPLDFQVPQAALGAPDGLTGENPAASNYFGFPNVLSPFSGAYQGDEIVVVGEGGELTLELERFALTGAGPAIGVISNVSLWDADYPNGINFSPARIIGGGSAVVHVSEDGRIWHTLGLRTFDMPALYYVNAHPYATEAPSNPQLADFSVPFAGSLASFSGKDIAGTIAAFQQSPGIYSGGGTWLDLTGVPISQVGYVRFSIDDDGNPLTFNQLPIDAVVVAQGAVGAAVPEPAGMLWLAAAGLFIRRRGR